MSADDDLRPVYSFFDADVLVSSDVLRFLREEKEETACRRDRTTDEDIPGIFSDRPCDESDGSAEEQRIDN